jgi:hypothetical protein
MDVKKVDQSDPLDEASSDFAHEVRGLVEAHPLGTLLGALGVGYVLGGGLFTAMTRRLIGGGLRLGFQLAVLPAVERELGALAGDLGKTLGNLGKTGGPSTTQQGSHGAQNGKRD